MKKFIAFALFFAISLSLLSGCSGDPADTPVSNPGSNGDDGVVTETQDAFVVLPSQLISLEDAARLLGEEMTADEDKYDAVESGLTGKARGVYHTADESNSIFIFQIVVYQDSLLDKVLIDSMGGTKGQGNRNRANGLESETAEEIEGIGDWAYIDGLKKLMAEVNIGYGDYFLTLITTGTPKDSDFETYGDDHAAWRKEVLIEAGKLAVEHLKEILK